MSNKRPRALWNVSLAAKDTLRHLCLKPPDVYSSDTDDDADTGSSQSSKRQRSYYDLGDADGQGKACQEITLPQPEKQSCDLEDWEDLKELFVRAAEHYESDDITEAMPLLRGVINECHRFLRYYQDPSVLFIEQPKRHSISPNTLTPPEERLARDWGQDNENRSSRPSSRGSQHQASSRRKNQDLPTAFHTIFGITLYLFGNLIEGDSTLALPGEPDIGAAYWLAALDVFETGENLPCKVDGRPFDEDWRMAIAWGRTLVCLADEKASGKAIPEEPQWPPESPFSVIASGRLPMTRRMSLAASSAHDILVLAMDQFSRGIFHMPHPAQDGAGAAGAEAGAFSRPKELFTIASDVLGVAEKLVKLSEREYWARWADGVYNQMKMEVDAEAWRRPITSARGRCWLIVGTSRAEILEDALETGESGVLDSEDAEEAREGLKQAISYFERATGCDTPESVDSDSQEVHTLLAEALLTLANLTKDENSREELYSRAQAEGGGRIELDPPDDIMDQST